MYSVKQARLLSGFTQAQMARGLEITRETYIRLEKNPDKITVAQGRRISKITGVPFERIFFAKYST